MALNPLEELIFADMAQNYLGATAGGYQGVDEFGGGQEFVPGQAQFRAPQFAPQRAGLTSLQTRPGDISYRYATPGGQEELYGMPPPPDPLGQLGTQIPQVRNLQQLQTVLAKLKGVPDELASEILSRAMGRPYVSPKQATLQNALLQARAAHELRAPEREEAAEGRAESRQIRREGIEQSRQAREAQLNLQQEMMEMRRESQGGRKLNELRTLQQLAESAIDPVSKQAFTTLLNAELARLPGAAEMLTKQQQMGGGRVEAKPTTRKTVLPNGITVTRGAPTAGATPTTTEEIPVSMGEVEGGAPTPTQRPTFGASLANLIRPSGGGEATRAYQWQQEKKNLTEGARNAILARARELATKAGMNPMAPEIFLTPYIKIAQQEFMKRAKEGRGGQ